MKKKLILSPLILFPLMGFGAPQQPINGGTGIANNNANTLTLGAPLSLTGSNSSAFSVDSMSRGTRPWSQLTNTAGTSITAPETGLIFYDTTNFTLDYYDGS